jgi:hypothetical protein
VWRRDDFILTMLRLVLRLNFCTFMGVVYRQIVGYATGTACGGQVAHLYLEELLGPIIAAAVASIVIHKRYIDDGFLNEFIPRLVPARRSIPALCQPMTTCSGEY